MKFEELNLAPALLKAVLEQGYETPTPIQAQAIPAVLAGHDLLAGAQTGTGKTAAFTLPMLHRLSQSAAPKNKFGGKGIRALVLTPTRELAAQVEESVREYGKYLDINSTVVFGGVGMNPQIDRIKRGVDILVATPGRLLDLQQQGFLDLSTVQVLVLDEADRMLDMGFSEDVMEIASQLPKARQTAFFTATMTRRVLDFADELLTEPAKIEIAAQTAKHENIEQQAIFVDDIDHKRRLVRHILSQPDVKQAIVFVATKRDCDTLADELIVDGIRADALHGDMQQRDRTRTLTRLRSGQTEVLVATDVAARGIDVAGISHVINFDLPRFAEDYVHRVGRTGRAGATGTAVSLVGRQDAFPLKKIERFTGQKLIVTEIEGMIARFKPQERREGGGGGRGGFGGKPRHGNGQGRSYGDRSGAPRSGFGGHQQRREGGDERRPFAPRQDGDSHRSGPARDGRRFDDRSSAPRGDFAPRSDRGSSWGQQRDDRRPQGGQSREGGFRNGDRPRQGGQRNHGGRYGD